MMRLVRSLAFVLTCAAASLDASTVWIDTDPTIGSPFRDVDDTFALVLAFHSPELTIAGISTTYGNASVRATTEAATELTTRFGAPANLSGRDVFAGAKSAAELGHNTSATRALAAALRKHQHMTYLALGPLTNLATVLVLHPELSRRIDRIIVVGGTLGGRTRPALGPSGRFHIHDANIFKDPEATRVVMRSTIPLLLAPIENGAPLQMTPTEMSALQTSGPAGKFLARNSRLWSLFWTRVVHTDGGPVFDALPILAAARPETVVTMRCEAEVDSLGNLVVSRDLPRSRSRVGVCRPRNAMAKKMMIDRLRRSPR